MRKLDKEFEGLCELIQRRRNEAVGFLNYATVSTYWEIGAYVSARVKSSAWGSGTILQFVDYIKTRHPNLRGYGQRQIYNMVEFYDIYSSPEFQAVFRRLRLDEFVPGEALEIVQPAAAKIENAENLQSVTAKSEGAVILQSATAKLDDSAYVISPMPPFLALITFTHHSEIIHRCRGIEEKVFYILYAKRERLDTRELRRAIVNQSYESVLSKEKKVSKALKARYPDAEFMMKDKVFLEFLGLPEKHTEPKLRRGILDHMKKFILEIGKDYLYMGDEYHVKVGSNDKRLDLLFYHRGLRCLVDVELKAVKFKPEFISKMDVYLEALDRDVRRPDENPSVGLLLCPNVDDVEVKYTLDRTMSPVMVAEYRRLLIPEPVLKRTLEEYCRYMKSEIKAEE